ncbi:CTD phosphatase Fcp1 [Tilletia horrida]|uniref:RNA polymerase II subunit A C-terminal domain phosphatase n=1 Tax=Tilletia horrida TaxID=155126 RepID=A0AAN6JSR9_9BASI|nr:CTD phosphatase Fcp1 [Tilletia horrida]KAK0555336.1 CTD phosphatase Fcp1 [Tilletia horrida]KAK0568513.1 CTD phosphatase Fcp1 [Tilletia horrida]
MNSRLQAEASSSRAAGAGGTSADEPCSHPVQVGGLCAICGVELESLPTEEGAGQAEEAVSILHSHASLKVTRSEAARLHAQSTADLLSTRRLALIIDLDQTVIHATVDPTVGEWMKDKSNPNNAALKDVQRFRLGMDGQPVPRISKATKRARADHKNGTVGTNGHDPTQESEEESDKEGATNEKGDEAGDGEESNDDDDDDDDDEEDNNPALGCWYYIKPRPGLTAFLRQLSTLYELHVYTMGTRSYAASVCAIIDPDGTLFADRILSRDENSETSAASTNSAAAAAAFRKSLARLFPVDTSMVVIIDDRADVWKWSPNLVKVVPFDFFVGIGDINASFLPAAPTAHLSSGDDASSDESSTPTGNGASPSASSSASGSTSTAASSTTLANAVNPGDPIAENVDGVQRAVLEQVTAERPLAKMQEALTDAKTEAVTPTVVQEHRPAVLKEDDRELQRLERILGDIHARWYAQWTKVEQETSGKSGGGEMDALARMPDVANVIAQMKSTVLQGCHIVFSGVVPLGQNQESSEPWRTATQFGAQCHRDLGSSVTHLVAARGGTAKVYQAQRQKHPKIWIVQPRWLNESCERWERASETKFQLDESSDSAPGPSRMGLVPGAPPPPPTDLQGDATRPGADEDETDLEEAVRTPPSGSSTNVATFGGFEGLDWGEAADEVDAFLDGLDDEGDTTDGGYNSDQSMSQSTTLDRKRQRTDDDEVEGNQAASSSGPSHSGLDAEAASSPLSKRRRLASERAGQSRLKHSFDPSTVDSDEDDEDENADARTETGRSASRRMSGGTASASSRRGSTTVDSDADDEDDTGARRNEKAKGTPKRSANIDDDEEEDDGDDGSGNKRHSLFVKRAKGKNQHSSTATQTQVQEPPSDDDGGSIGSAMDDSFLDGLADEIALDLEEGD